MSGSKIFPAANSDFNDYVNEAAPYIGNNKTRLLVSGDNLTKLGTEMTVWNDIYPQSADLENTTQTIINKRNKSRKRLEDILRDIYKDIPESVLTEDDRSVLNLFERGAASPVGRADFSPGLEMAKVIHLEHTLRIKNGLDTSKRAMPRGQKVLLERYVGAAKMDTAAIPWGDATVVGRSIFKIIYTDADEGKTAYYRAYYTNNKGEKGPPSKVLSYGII